LRCLIDKVVVHRPAPDMLQVRIVWRGGATTTAALPVTVGSLARLSSGPEMEKTILERARAGKTDEEIADLLTRAGHRSPRHATVLPSTARQLPIPAEPDRAVVNPVVDPVRSDPQGTGDLRHPQATGDAARVRLPALAPQPMAQALTIPYLFPDKPQTIAQFRQLRAGRLQKLRF
jgi:hypothetical protein